VTKFNKRLSSSTDFIKQLKIILSAQDRKKLLISFGFLLINSLFTMLGIVTVFPFIDALLYPKTSFLERLFPGVSFNLLLSFSAVLIIFGFALKNQMAFICLRKQTNLLYQVAYSLAQRLFSLYLKTSYLEILKRNTPDIIRNLTNEYAVLASGVFLPLGAILAESCTSFLILCILFYLNPVFTVIVIISLGFLICFFIKKISQKLGVYSHTRTTAWSAMARYVIQSMGGIKETKIYELEPFFMEGFKAQAQAATESAAFAAAHGQAPRFFLEASMLAVIMVTITVMIIVGMDSHKIVLLLAVFAIASSQLMPSLNRLLMAINNLRYSLPAFTTIASALSQEGSNNYLNNNFTNNLNSKVMLKDKIRIQDVCFTYPAGRQALNQLSLSIQKGKITALVGFSGAGKTTLVDMLLGLLKPDSGKIWIDDLELNQDSLSSWRKNIAYVPQSIYLYDCSIKENVAFGVEANLIPDQKIWDALEAASLKEFVSALPEQLNTQIGENGVSLSGGQKQRLGIARALFRNADVLVMDEATSALDGSTEQEIQQAMVRAAQSRTTIVIAHRLSTIAHSDFIFILDQGRVASSGTYEQLSESCPIFREKILLGVK